MCQKYNVKFGDVTILSGNAMQDLPWRKRAPSRLFFFPESLTKLTFLSNQKACRKNGGFLLKFGRLGRIS